MKKIVITLLCLFSTLFIYTLPAMAFDSTGTICSTGSASSSSVCHSSSGGNPISGANGILTKVIDIITIIVGIVSVIMIVIGGLQYVISSGESARTNTAKNTILYAIVGLVIVAIGQILVAFVINHA